MKEFNEFFETDLKEKNFNEEEEIKRYKRITKIFISILMFFIILFLFIGKGKADTINPIIIDYSHFNTDYVSYFEEIDSLINLNNTYDLDYTIIYNSRDNTPIMYVSIYKKYTGMTSTNVEYNYQTMAYYRYDSSNPYAIISQIGYASDNSNLENTRTGRNDFSISLNDFENNKEQFKQNILDFLSTDNTTIFNTDNNNRRYSMRQSTSFTFPVIYGYSFIYSSSMPTYYYKNYAGITKNTTYTCENLGNDYLGNTLYQYNTIFYDGSTTTTLNCGDEIPSYKELNANNYSEIYSSIEHLTKSINSFDIYFTQNEISKMKVEFSQESGNLNDSNFYQQKYYGKKCNNNTCYWEELQNGGVNVNVTRTFSDIIGNNQGGVIYYDYNINMIDYDTIKMAIVVYNPDLLTNYNIKLYSQNASTTLYTDKNYIAYNYNRDEFKVQDNYISVLVQLKDTTNNYTYYNWSKAYNNWVIEDTNNNFILTSMDYLFPYTYRYNLNNYTIIEESINQMPSSTYNGERLSFSQIELSNTQALYLGFYFIQRNYETRFWNYFTDDVYYTISDNLNFVTDYNNNSETINTISAPSLINSEYTDAYNIDLTDIQNIILSYYDKKESWLQLFNSVWFTMPEIIKNILIISYTLGLCLGLLLIWKD